MRQLLLEQSVGQIFQLWSFCVADCVKTPNRHGNEYLNMSFLLRQTYIVIWIPSNFCFLWKISFRMESSKQIMQ